MTADELVRREAARRLRAMAAHMPHREGLHALADLIEVDDRAWVTAAAHALLAPTAQPVTAPGKP